MKQWYEKLVQFFKEMRMELSKVSWPSRNELTVSTMAVVFFTVAMAGFIGIIDYALVKILEILTAR
ncbi:MAG: preprotein translocase subunit SecE [Limisphaerales bacterium]